MKKLLLIIIVATNGICLYGQTLGPEEKKSSNIKYIDISIQQPGVEECLGVNIPRQGDITDWIDVYPNPNPGQFTVELELTEAGAALLIQMFDLAGKLVLTINEMPESNYLRIDLDVSHLKKGVYFLHVTGKDKVGVKQIIIN